MTYQEALRCARRCVTVQRPLAWGVAAMLLELVEDLGGQLKREEEVSEVLARNEAELSLALDILARRYDVVGSVWPEYVEESRQEARERLDK